MRIELDGNTYHVEERDGAVRVGVVVTNSVRAQHPYVRWLSPEGRTAARVIAAADKGGEAPPCP